jgi:hypothetical protein
MRSSIPPYSLSSPPHILLHDSIVSCLDRSPQLHRGRRYGATRSGWRQAAGAELLLGAFFSLSPSPRFIAPFRCLAERPLIHVLSQLPRETEAGAVLCFLASLCSIKFLLDDFDGWSHVEFLMRFSFIGLWLVVSFFFLHHVLPPFGFSKSLSSCVYYRNFIQISCG